MINKLTLITIFISLALPSTSKAVWTQTMNMPVIKKFENLDPRAKIQSLKITEVIETVYFQIQENLDQTQILIRFEILLNGVDSTDQLKNQILERASAFHSLISRAQECSNLIILDIPFDQEGAIYDVLEQINVFEPIEPEDSLAEMRHSILELIITQEDLGPMREYLHTTPLSGTELDFLSDEFEQRLWEESVENGTHSRHETQILPDDHYWTITDKNEAESFCTICRIGAGDPDFNTPENPAVRVSCGSRHSFCLACISDSFHYQRVCPECRQLIRPKAE